jgi:hypothetical protein
MDRETVPVSTEVEELLDEVFAREHGHDPRPGLEEGATQGLLTGLLISAMLWGAGILLALKIL